MVLTGPGDGGVTYADLESAATVVLVGLEPEDEAGAIFLRLRKAATTGRTRVLGVAPFATRGLHKMRGTLLPTAPGDEPATLDSLVEHAEHGIDATSVILVGERLATVPGALTAAATLARRTGARLAWVPRRAGDRGAVEAGCLPTLLPGGRPVADAGARVDAATAWGVGTLPETPGRDADAIVAALVAGELGGLVVGGVDPDDTTDPAATRAAIEAAASWSPSSCARPTSRAPPTSSSRWLRSPTRPAPSSPGRAARDPSSRCSATPARCPTCGSSPASPTSSRASARAARWASAPSRRCATGWSRWARGTVSA